MKNKTNKKWKKLEKENMEKSKLMTKRRRSKKKKENYLKNAYDKISRVWTLFKQNVNWTQNT